MFNNAFKSLLRFLKENGFTYKCRLYSNSQFATNCYTEVLYYRMFKYSLCKKSTLLLSGKASMPFLRDTLVWTTAYYPYPLICDSTISLEFHVHFSILSINILGQKRNAAYNNQKYCVLNESGKISASICVLLFFFCTFSRLIY